MRCLQRIFHSSTVYLQQYLNIHPRLKVFQAPFVKTLRLHSYNVVKLEEHTLALASYYYSNSNASMPMYVNKPCRNLYRNDVTVVVKLTSSLLSPASRVLAVGSVLDCWRQ